jgi:hypothetical protein
MTLFSTIKKNDLKDLETFLNQISFDLEQIEAISETYVNETYCELEVFIGESYPYYFQLPSSVFIRYAEEFFESDILPYIKNDAEFNDALKQMQSEDFPIVFWYREVADKRDKLDCSKYFVRQFFGDFASELLIK